MTDWRRNTMSDLTSIVLIAALFIPGFAVLLFADRWTHERGDALAIGVMQGVPLSTKHRWLLLFNNWLALAFGVTLYSLALAVVFAGVARNLTDSLAKSLAYLCAVGFGFSCAFWLILGTSWFIFYVSVLRESKRN
jgi:hypothetical protein